MRKHLTIATLLVAGTAVAHVPGPDVTLGGQIAHVLAGGHHTPIIIAVLAVLAGTLWIARRARVAKQVRSIRAAGMIARWGALLRRKMRNS